MGARRAATWVAAVLLALIASADAAAQLPYGFVDELVADGFEYTTDVCLLPGPGTRLITLEKDGLVRLVVNGKIQSKPFLDIRNIVHSYLDRGLISCAVDSSFGSFPYIYLAHVVETNKNDSQGPKTAQVVRYTVNGARNGVMAGSRRVLLGSKTGNGCSKFQLKDDVICCDSLTHAAGGLDFADGYLWVTIGDGAFPRQADDLTMRAQEVDSLNGKVLRVDRNGNGVAGNPFFRNDVQKGDNRAKVWALGCRNAWRIKYDKKFRAPFLADVGWANFEEVNLAKRAANLEWPCLEGRRETAAFSGYAQCKFVVAGNPIHGTNQEPIVDYSHKVGSAVSSALRVTLSKWPKAFRDNWVYYTDYVGGWMKRVKIDDQGRRVGAPVDFAEGLRGPVQLLEGPDGTLWYLSISGQALRRIRYQVDNSPPRVRSVSPPNGATGIETTVQISITLNKFVNEGSLKSGVRLAVASSGKNVDGRVSWDSALLLVTFVPKSSLQPNTDYVLTVNSAVKDPDGRALTPKLTAKFSTGTGFTRFVSDLKFVREENSNGPVERDQHNGFNVPNDGDPISIRGVVYPKGIGVGPPSEVAVVVPKGCTRFISACGVDDGSENLDGGAAFCEVKVGGKQVYSSTSDHKGPLTRTDDPVEILLNVAGGAVLAMVTRNGGWSRINQNRVSWGGARFRCGGFDDARPKVTGVVPKRNTNKVSIASPVIRLTFSESMDLGSLLAAVRLRANGEEVGWSPVANEKVTTLTLAVEGLVYRTTYRITVSKDALDIAGNKLENAFAAEFTTEKEPATGTKIFLDELKPVVQGSGTYKKGEAKIGTLAGLAVRTFKSGLGIKAPAKLTFKVPKGCKRFIAYYGVDPRLDAFADFRLQIGTRERGNLQTRRIRSPSLAERISVQTHGGEYLQIRAHIGEHGAKSDYLIVAEPKFTCTGDRVLDVATRTPDGAKGTWRRNASADGGPLRLRIQVSQPKKTFKSYQRSFIVEPRAVASYKLPGECSLVKADVGIHSSMASKGSMVFEFQAGAKACSVEKVGGSGPTTLQCPVRSKQLQVRATNANDGQYGDVGVFGNAQLDCSKKAKEPRCEIDKLPAPFRVGDVVEFSGKAFAFDNSRLNDARMRWTIIMHHCPPNGCHTHKILDARGRRGTFKVPNHEDYIFLEFQCKVCEGELCTTSSANLFPKAAVITVKTEPSGLLVGVDSINGAGPLTARVVVKSSVEISTVANQNGLRFLRWKHAPSAGAKTTVNVQDAKARTFTAVFG